MSIPIASLYPPTAVSTTVSIPFARNILGPAEGTTLMPTLNLNDVTWTKN